MSKRKPRKPFQPKKRPHDLGAFLAGEMKRVRAAVPFAAQITIVARHPIDRNAEIVFSDDDFDQLIGCLTRRREQVEASRAAAATGATTDE